MHRRRISNEPERLSEVEGVLITEYDEAKTLQYLRDEARDMGHEEGLEEGREEGRDEARSQFLSRIISMLRNGDLTLEQALALGFTEQELQQA